MEEVSQLTFYGSQDFILFDILVICSGLRFGTGSRVRCGKPPSRGRNFTKVPKPIHHFKAYRSKNDVEMFLTREIEYKMYCDQQMQNEAIFIKATNSRRILAFRSKQ